MYAACWPVGPLPSPRKLRENSPDATKEKKPASSRNIPLAQNENEKARELVTLDEKFLRDVAHMPPAAASYVRRHRCLTLAAMEKWRVGVLPQDAGSDKRGWSLRGQLLYPILSEDGKLLAWVARDPQFEAKEQAFKALVPDEARQGKAARQASVPRRFPPRPGTVRRSTPAAWRSPAVARRSPRCGIIVVEGFNDVIGLDAIGVPAVAIMSNKITEQQIAKVERWSKNLAGGKVTLLFDADDAGDDGAKEALWLLAQRGLDVRLGWSKPVHGGNFAGSSAREPDQRGMGASHPTGDCALSVGSAVHAGTDIGDGMAIGEGNQSPRCCPSAVWRRSATSSEPGHPPPSTRQTVVASDEFVPPALNQSASPPACPMVRRRTAWPSCSETPTSRTMRPFSTRPM